ncbi:MAG TPA: hypothetical protein VGD69_28030 [Herpetosiphonaceae bacterium]
MSRPLAEVFDELVALGTAADRIWPDPKMPFRRTDGPMRVGITQEQHGPLRAVLDRYEVNQRIVWRANLSFLRGTHSFEVQEAGSGSTLVRHVIRIKLAWWFGPVWSLYVSGIHDRILEGLLDRLAGSATPAEARA